MFEAIITDFYDSLSTSIEERKDYLKLKRWDILKDQTRVTDIIKKRRNEHHPYMIGSTEYKYLADLYRFNNKTDFLEQGLLNTRKEEFANYEYHDYDQLLWGHINWDKMLRKVIKELSEETIPESLKNLFEETLIDYVPYAMVKNKDMHPKYAKIYFFPEDIQERRTKAINWVHLSNGNSFFKSAFLKKFSSKNLKKFDENFIEFITAYLVAKKPQKYSLGLQAYNLRINASAYIAFMQSKIEYQYKDIHSKEAEQYELLENYEKNVYRLINEFEQIQSKFQNEFTAFNEESK